MLRLPPRRRRRTVGPALLRRRDYHSRTLSTPMMPTARPYVGDEEIEAVAGVLRGGWLGSGATALAFEVGVRGLVGCGHVLVVNSGTAALKLAAEALGLGLGDEVIVSSLTFCACP